MSFGGNPPEAWYPSGGVKSPAAMRDLNHKSIKAPEIFFKSLEIKNLSIYFDIETNLVNLFRLRGLPTTIILNKDRKEIARVLGAVNFSDQRFIDWINSVSN